MSIMHKKIRKASKETIPKKTVSPDTPAFPESTYQLGIQALCLKNFKQAENYFLQATQADSNQPHYWLALGSVAQQQGKPNGAIRYFCKALELHPGFSQAWNQLGSLYQAQAKLVEAEKCYQKSTEFQPDSFDAYLGLGHTLIARGKMKDAEKALRRALCLNPNHIQALHSLAYSLKEQNRHAEATSVYRHACSSQPDNLKAFIGAHLTLPAVYSSTAELFAARNRYAEGLKALHDHTKNLLKTKSKELLSGLNWTNFYLAYQGEDDKPMQMEYAHFIANILQIAAPDLMQPIQKNQTAGQRRWRIGFLSSFMRNCTVGSYFKSWVTLLNKELFEIYCYQIGNTQDQVTQEFIHASDCYKYLAGDADYIGRQVKQDCLDILVYPEVGMDPVILILAAMRLAPIQCTAWGHPVTTGHANMDYFFSSALMEPENAQAHYSEQLILLEGIGTCYSKPVLPSPARRHDFSLPEKRILYLCPQSLYKIHPDNDRLLLEILARNKNASLVFFQAMDISITHAFIKRIEAILNEAGIEKTGQIKMLPRMEHANYLQVNMLCDAMLDTLHWSGGNTTLDALACGLPVVTMPGKFMRGRQSYGMLKYMELHELIAHNQQEYIEIAIKLGTDHTWRQQISQRITKSCNLIFSMEKPLHQMEHFFSMQLKAGPSVSGSHDVEKHSV